MKKINQLLSDEEILKTLGDLAEIAEPSLHEFKTTEYIIDFLKAIGLTPVKTNPTGCFGTIDTGSDITVALRADIDALPANPEKTVYKHLCGHHSNTATLLMTLKHIMQSEEKPKVNIRYIFQPAEELVSGAQIMIDAGCLDGVSLIFAGHTEPGLPVGKIGIKQGPAMAGSNHFKIYFKGASTHGAYPHKGNDCVTAAANYIMNVQTIITRLKDPTLPGLISFGSIHGGSASNSLPEKVSLEGTFRHFHKEILKLIPEKMQTVLNGINETYGVKGELLVYDGTPPVYNDEKLSAFTENLFNSLGFDIEPYNIMSMGGEDFAFYMQHVPGVFIWIGSGETQTHPPLHNENYFVPAKTVITSCDAWINNIYNVHRYF